MRGKVESVKAKCRAYGVTSEEAEKFAHDFDLPEEDLIRFGEIIERIAAKRDLPELPPELELLEMFLDWEFFNLIRAKRLDARLEKMTLPGRDRNPQAGKSEGHSSQNKERNQALEKRTSDPLPASTDEFNAARAQEHVPGVATFDNV